MFGCELVVRHNFLHRVSVINVIIASEQHNESDAGRNYEQIDSRESVCDLRRE